MSAIIELRRRSSHGIFAVPYRRHRPGRPIPLPDGAIVESPTPRQRHEAPGRLPGCFDIAQGGIPGTIHHSNLGLIVAHLPFEGVFVLPSGDVTAVYGAEADTIH